uniref:Uncharacterized protein n=1 Tax=Salix viminalis TaxID=40686 RepID=A0A6N2KPD2_SALVM
MAVSKISFGVIAAIIFAILVSSGSWPIFSSCSITHKRRSSNRPGNSVYSNVCGIVSSVAPMPPPLIASAGTKKLVCTPIPAYSEVA